MDIIELPTLNKNDIEQLTHLIDKCNGYEPYYNCNSVHFAAYTDSGSAIKRKKTSTKADMVMIGFISFIPVIIPPDDSLSCDSSGCNSSVCDSSICSSSVFDSSCAEVTALVDPDYRRQHIFTKLLDAIRRKGQMLRINNLICSLPESLTKIAVTLHPAYTEYFMKYSFSEYVSSDNNQSDKGISGNNISYNDISDNLKFDKNKFECFFSDDETEYLLYINDYSHTDTATAFDASSDNSKKNILSEEPIAVLNLDYQESFTNIYGVFVDEKLRNKGIGTFLIKHLICDYFKQNEVPLLLNVHSFNKAALKLYKKCGFEIQDRIDYYYI